MESSDCKHATVVGLMAAAAAYKPSVYVFS